MTRITSKDQWVKTPEARHMLGITLPTLYRMMKNGKIRAINISAGSIRNNWRISRIDIQKILQEGMPRNETQKETISAV